MFAPQAFTFLYAEKYLWELGQDWLNEISSLSLSLSPGRLFASSLSFSCYRFLWNVHAHLTDFVNLMDHFACEA